MSNNARHFIVGYGSLINSLSRNVTGDTGRAVPVKITGFVRHWAKITEGFGMSSVVVVPSDCKTSKCNGVLVEVNESEFPNFDEREHGYQRVLVDSKAVSFYNEVDKHCIMNKKDDANIWIYQATEVVHPSVEFPVVLSYLDVILAGCLEFSTEFCDDFLEMTQGWQYSMLNDRLVPRYPRVQTGLDTALLNSYLKKKSPLNEEELEQTYLQ